MSSQEEEHLIWKILLTHNLDDSHQLDSELLLWAIENVICCSTPEIIRQLSLQDCVKQIDATSIVNTEEIRVGRHLGYTLYEMQYKILHRCFEDQDLHDQVMFVFEMLGKFQWDAKVVLVLAAFGISYGQYWLITQLRSHNRLAAMTGALKSFPDNLTVLRKEFKAMTLLINRMVEVSRAIVHLESLPLHHELLENEVLSAANSKIYIAAYWTVRSSITCSSLIAGLKTIRHNQVYPVSKAITAVTIYSLVQKLDGLFSDLKQQLGICKLPIESRLYEKLQNLFKETHIDNQEVLRVLFSLRYVFPFKKFGSQEKCGIGDLKNKVVILLISKPELLPVEDIFLLLQQICDHPDKQAVEEKFAVVWVPISCHSTWNRADEMNYHFFSNSLPFFSVRQPWSLNQAVISYIKQEWNFKEEPIMVVLDVNGEVSNSNARDMVWIWGARAFPFSTSREEDLWEQETVPLHLIIDGIDPLLTKRVEEGKNICIYASDDLDWIREFNSAVTEIRAAGIQLETMYVGWSNPSDSIQSVQEIVDQEKSTPSLSFMKIRLFWHRLESIKNSICRLNKNAAVCDEISGLLDFNERGKGWALVGTGSSSEAVKLQGENLRHCFKILPVWAKYVPKLGLVSTIRKTLELPFEDNKPGEQSEFLDRVLICSKCRRPVEALAVYRCDESDQEIDNL